MAYQIAAAEAELKANEYLPYQLKIEEAENQLLQLDERIEQAQNAAQTAIEQEDWIAYLNAVALIDSLYAQIDQIDAAITEYRLQRSLAVFYKDNKDALLQGQYTLLDFEKYKLECALWLDDLQGRYLSASIAELEAKLAVEQKKLELGYTTASAVKMLEAQLNTARAKLDALSLDRESTNASLSRFGGGTSNFHLENGLENLKDDYLSDFSKKNLQVEFYAVKIAAYKTYAKNTTLNANQDSAKLQIDLTEMEAKRYSEDLKMYVEQLYNKYSSLQIQYAATANEIEAQQNMIAAATALYEHGQIQRVSLTELETELTRLEYQQADLQVRGAILHYILEHRIENQTV